MAKANKGTRMSEFKPKAWMTCPLCHKPSPFPDPDYREWVGLTDEEIQNFRPRYKFSKELLKEIETILKEKNT